MSEKQSGRSASWVDPLTRPVVAATVPVTGIDMTVEPSAEERARMADALDLASVDRLSATYRLRAAAGGVIEVTGELVARVQPVCVVSLEPFVMSLREPVELRFADPAAAPRRAPASEEDVSGEDPPDPIENGIIDLGHITTEFLSLALPMYPRKPDAAFDAPDVTEEPSPFAKLSVLKPKT